jgi:hypothetical protein
MRKRHETIPAMTRLVESGDIQSGFKKLKKLGLAQEWSIEAIILNIRTSLLRLRWNVHAGG